MNGRVAREIRREAFRELINNKEAWPKMSKKQIERVLKRKYYRERNADKRSS